MESLKKKYRWHCHSCGTGGDAGQEILRCPECGSYSVTNKQVKG